MAGAILLSLVLEWYGATSEVPWLLLLSAWLLALLVAAGVYAAWNSTGLRLELQAGGVRAAPGSPLEEMPEPLLRGAPPSGALFEGDALQLEVRLKTTGSTRGPATASGWVGGRPAGFSTGLVPRAGRRGTFDVPALRRGPLGATSWEIVAGDCLGFFRTRKRCPEAEVGLVLPRFASLRGRRGGRELEASAAAPRAGSGNELFGIREYRAGDSLRRVHWRSSARHGELVVREHEPPGGPELSVLLDPAPASPDFADQMARIAASEVWDCLREGGRVWLWGPGLEPSGAPRDWWELLAWLARYPSHAPADGPPPPAREVVVVTAGDARVIEAAEVAGGRGARVRGWVVGEAGIDLDIPIERVGTAWPL